VEKGKEQEGRKSKAKEDEMHLLIFEIRYKDVQ
jgi:hypothetical protein